jgi:glutaredoxin
MAPSLVIYSRPGCHLCDDMKAVVDRVAQSMEMAVQEVDISGDPELEARYGTEIPVLTINGKKAAKYRVTETELRRLLLGRMVAESR